MDKRYDYVPNPIDMTGVELPESLGPFLEALAENVHETWAKGRMDAGWTFGPVRDEVKKLHPCLVPYSELPESEKAYDRETVISTLKFICKMGFRIDLTMNQTIKELRQLLYGECVVALDTNVLINLEEKDEPAWFKDFVKMREAGVKFSIPDLCIGEIITRFECAEPKYLPNMKDEWLRMMSRLNYIIWRELPCLPLRGDLYDLFGIKESGKKYLVRTRPFSVERAKELYRFLGDYESSQYNTVPYRAPIIDEFKKVRREWKDEIVKGREKAKGKTIEEVCEGRLAELESAFTAPVKVSSLFELPVRLSAEFALNRDYKPTDDDDISCLQGRKKKPSNDGLDYQILYLTMASINVCSCDGFFLRARKLGLSRSCCCHNPETIFKEWEKRTLPFTTVPLSISEDGN